VSNLAYYDFGQGCPCARSFYRGELALLKSLWLDSVQAGVSPAKRETAGTSEPFARHGGQAEQAAVASPELQGAIS